MKITQGTMEQHEMNEHSSYRTPRQKREKGAEI